MIPWEKIKIDLSELKKVEQLYKKNHLKNPACHMIKYWSGRMSSQMVRESKEKKGLPYGWVGDGWPHYSDQTEALKHDKLGVARAFDEVNCRDKGDAVYQCNRILKHDTFNNGLRIKICDFGGGYGRLAVPFLYYLGMYVQYISVDTVPLSLIVAPQFINQATETKACDWKTEIKSGHRFVSLPAWRIDEIKNEKFDVFISTHSFQEMTRASVDFYIDFASKSKGAIFYDVNIHEDIGSDYIPDNWEFLSNHGYPINRDGSYLERIWRIRQ